ncbi:MAG TPA: MBL fold metallo-hydrolase [Chitinophagaceae bacterium]|nr:MBL fold metallo-hydrolase [Chitinophagaceae bacterium]
MSLFISSLNSGSNGNCYYVGNETDAILVDAGISCREIEKRIKRLGLHIQKVKAVFISHEHSDHIRGLEVLSKKFRLPVYITDATLSSTGFSIEKDLVRTFTAHERITIGQMSVTAFPKFHDATDPYSFVVSCNEINVGVFTDIGQPCNEVIRYFKSCHAAFLEANYDDEMLENGKYPYYLKKRISGERGHLSNKQALDLFKVHRPAFMSHLVLSHLSKNNNCPKLVGELFNLHAKQTKIVVASRFHETEVMEITEMMKRKYSGSFEQLSLAL